MIVTIAAIAGKKTYNNKGYALFLNLTQRHESHLLRPERRP